MEHVATFTVPILAELALGPNWRDIKKVALADCRACAICFCWQRLFTPKMYNCYATPRSEMRIVSWNCCGGFASKKNELLALDPDIAIISESLLADADSLKPQGYKSIWFGDGGQKGLAIIYKSSWSIRQQGPSLHKWIIPLDVSGPESFTLLAVWAWLEKGRPADYVKVIRRALAEHPDWLLNSSVVMAGDFNSHWKWDAEPENDFASLVADLNTHGLLSAYHLHHDECGGSETRPTYHHNWSLDQPHHIDYIFIPAGWRTRLKHFEVGRPDHWLGLRLSDHCPLTADISAA
jgi:exonuclease III